MRIEGQANVLELFPAAPLSQGPKPTVERDSGQVKEAAPPYQEERPDRKDVQQAVNYSNDVMKLANYHLEFQVQDDSSKYQVKVVDTDSGDVIREIPPDYMMKIAEQLRGKIHAEAGLLIDRIA